MTYNRKRKGATVIEFAFIFPAFMLLVFFVLSGMMVMSGVSVLQSACNQASHDMADATSPTVEDAEDAAMQHAASQGYGDNSGMEFTATTVPCEKMTCMQINGTWTVNWPLVRYIFPNMTFKGQAIMPINTGTTG